jgi:N-acetylmuramoyl-L-alanine amidase
VYFDLQGAQPADDLAAVTAVNDAVLAQIRAGRYDDATTRVVLDLKAMQRFEVKDFRLPGERKIVVDVYPTEAVLAAARRKVAPVPVPRLASVPVVPAAPARPAALTAQTQQPAPRPARADAPAPQPTPAANRLLPEPLVNVPVGLQVRSIMIDPGHGGHDPGALGYGTAEKDLTLAISRKLRQLLHERHPALRVGMTRDSDAFIALQERPLIAKRFGADLFVSVHLNANPNRRFHGVETYFLNLTQDRDALQVAARENGTSEQRLSDLNDILLDLLRDSNLIESGELAKAVQASLVGTLRAEHGPVRDLGVKQAPFLVLMGAEMPSVLVEAGFVTNREEHGRLQDPDYLNRIAEGIYDGLRRYIEQQNIIATDHPAGPLAANDRP